MSKKAVVVVSYGTSYDCTREKTIGAVEKAVADAFPDRELRRAFTARMVIDILIEKNGIRIDFIENALQRLHDEGFDDVIVISTHIMNGGQYDYAMDSVRKYKDKFENIAIGTALLTSRADFDDVMNAVIKEFYPAEKDSALVLMGHGTVHYANSTYSELQLKFWFSGYENVYVTTAEGFPTFEDTIKCMRGKGYRKVRMVPLMVVAGDHANNDLAGDGEDSLNSLLKAEGYETEPIVKGLGENKSFQGLFVRHALAAKKI